ncbi:hypothetical protein J6590_090962 [Homalodisca vitripennis]|nr:hypothetical protein J6590_090962 [Homalodisca vitripennis]
MLDDPLTISQGQSFRIVELTYRQSAFIDGIEQLQLDLECKESEECVQALPRSISLWAVTPPYQNDVDTKTDSVTIALNSTECKQCVEKE